MTAQPALSLHRKLAKVMGEAERIPKNGVAPPQMGSFRFVQVGDAADAIRKALAEQAVSMIPTAIEVVGESEHETSNHKIMTTLTVRTTWTLTDGESGESITIQSLGSGADTGDKAAPKAQSNAMKYALLMGFLLSTGDDPEQADTSDRHQRAAPPRLGPRPDPATEEPAPTKEPYSEQEELVGRVRRAGTIRKGTSAAYQLDARQGPDGHVIGFRLEVGPEKHIPQCVVAGPLGEALFLATAGEPAKLAGTRATVAGILYHVKGSRGPSWYRLHVDRFENDDFILPADPADGPVPEPTEALPEPLFDEDEQKRIDAALSEVPA